MEILYEYTVGSAPNLVLAIFMWSAAAVVFFLGVGFAISEREWRIFWSCGTLALFLAVIGHVYNENTIHQEVKAIINSTVSFEEINKKYELIKQEGELYTFKVREDEE